MRVEQIGDCTLYLADCLDVMKRMADNSVDCVVTDPPYGGLTGNARHYADGVAKRKERSVTIGDQWNACLVWTDDVERIVKCTLFVFCSFHTVAEIRAKFGKLKAINLFVWYKRNAPPKMKNCPRYTTEYIWAFSLDVGCKWNSFSTSLFDIPNINPGCVSTGERLTRVDGTALHPTQKPLELIRNIVWPTQGTVLDPFMGSGTTGVACVNLGRKFIGVEIDEDYFNISCERIYEANRQLKLFKPKEDESCGAKPTLLPGM